MPDARIQHRRHTAPGLDTQSGVARSNRALSGQSSVEIFNMIGNGELTLRPGMAHPAVATIQRALNRFIMQNPRFSVREKSGFDARINVSSTLDPQTCQALRFLQNYVKIRATSSVDRSTMSVLFPQGRPNVPGVAVERLGLNRSAVAHFRAHPNGVTFSFNCERFTSPAAEAAARVPHVPNVRGSRSGLTVIGFDIGERTKEHVQELLAAVGVKARGGWKLFIEGAGLRGREALAYFKRHESSLTGVAITPKQERELFGSVYRQAELSAERLYDKWCAIRMKGRDHLEWQELSPRVRSLLTDLRLRGDNTPKVRAEILESAATGNDRRFFLKMCNKAYWVDRRDVPIGRYQQRAEYAAAGLLDLKNKAPVR